MADDDKKADDKKVEAASDAAEEAANDAEEAAEKSEEAAEKAKEAVEKLEEKVEEVKQEVKEAAEETKKESSKPSQPSAPSTPSKPSVKVSKKLEGIISDIEKLSVIELSELVKALEEKFGVSAAQVAPVTTTGGAATPTTGEEGASEQTTFNVILADSGTNKISVIKAIREIVPTLGLKEAKDLTDNTPKPVLEGANKDNATEAKQKLEAAGAKVELK